MAGDDWKYGLIRDIADPSKHIVRSDLAVVICDKYPKALRHFLVLPLLAEIDNVYELTPEDVPLLWEMKRLAVKAAKSSGLPLANFRMGFHIDPALHRLHMHMISQDFVSNRLRTSEHYNSFNTALFMPFKKVLRELESTGRIMKRSPKFIEQLHKTSLACNQCHFRFGIGTNILKLKAHLYKHHTDASVTQI